MSNVIVGESALTRNGLSTCDPVILCTTINSMTFNRAQVGRRFFFYVPGIDCTNFGNTIRVAGEDLFLPTPERAIIDCLRFDIADEGFVCEAIVNYLEDSSNHGTREKLYEVADFYQYPRSEVDRWIREAYEYCAES